MHVLVSLVQKRLNRRLLTRAHQRVQDLHQSRVEEAY